MIKTLQLKSPEFTMFWYKIKAAQYVTKITHQVIRDMHKNKTIEEIRNLKYDVGLISEAYQNIRNIDTKMNYLDKAYKYLPSLVITDLHTKVVQDYYHWAYGIKGMDLDLRPTYQRFDKGVEVVYRKGAGCDIKDGILYFPKQCKIDPINVSNNISNFISFNNVLIKGKFKVDKKGTPIQSTVDFRILIQYEATPDAGLYEIIQSEEEIIDNNKANDKIQKQLNLQNIDNLVNKL